MPYQVFVDDNFAFMDESERYLVGVYPTAEEAIKNCKRIVDASLDEMLNEGISAIKLYDRYTSFGEDPWIKGETRNERKAEFSAWDCAKQRCSIIYLQGAETPLAYSCS